MARVGGAQEVQFFAANLLLNKVRREWGRLPAESQGQLSQAFSARLNEMVGAGDQVARVVVNRVAMVMAVAAVQTSVKAAEAVLNSMLQTLAAGAGSDSNLRTVVQVINAVAEESEGLERAKRGPVVRMLNVRADEVFKVIQEMLAGNVSVGAAEDAIRCLHNWLRLDPAGTGMLSQGPGPFSTNFPALFENLVQRLVQPEGRLASAAAEVLADVLGPNAQYDAQDPQAEYTASMAAVGFVLRSKAALAGENDEGLLLRGATRIIVAICDRNVAFLTGKQNEALLVAEFMVEALACRDRGVAENCIEYFLMTNTVPVAERHPELHASMWAKVVPNLLAIASFPEDFTTWEEALDDDADGFHQFREQSVADALDTAYGILKLQYLQLLGGTLDAPGSWQHAEAAIFGARVVSVSVKAQMSSRHLLDNLGANPQGTNEGKAHAHQFLLTYMARVAEAATGNGSNPQAQLFQSHPAVVEATCRFVGSFAGWFIMIPPFGQEDQAPLEGVLRYLLGAMTVPAAFKHATAGFRNVCARCSGRLAAYPVVSALLGAAQPAIGSDTEVEGRMAVVEGLARVLSSMGPKEASELGQQLLNPLIGRAQQLGNVDAGGAAPEAQAKALAAEIQLMASVIRFMEFPGGAEGEQHPALVLLQHAWPILSGITQSAVWGAQELVVNAVCEVHQRTLLCTKQYGEPLLAVLLNECVPLIEKYMHPACLDTIGTGVEVLGMVPDCAQQLKVAFETVGDKVLKHLQQVDPAAHGDLIRGLFEMAGRFFVFAPPVVLQSQSLSVLIVTAVAAVRLKERDSVKSALSFLSNVLAPGERLRTSPAWVAASPNILTCVQSNTPNLVGALLYAAASTCPQFLLRMLAGSLYGLCEMLPQDSSHAITAHLTSAEYLQFVKGQNNSFQDSDLTVFKDIVLSGNLARPKFESCVYDFARLCRREAASDVLTGYQFTNSLINAKHLLRRVP